MTDGHEVWTPADNERRIHQILTALEDGDAISQRLLAKRIGIALGLTNLIVRRLVGQGLVQVSRAKANRVSYLLTPAGIAEKARMTRAYFAATTRFYAEARDRIQERFVALAAETRTGGTPARDIAFLGAADVAEIGYVCLQATDLRLVAVFDETRLRPFFGMAVRPLAELRRPEARTFDRLVVMSFAETDAIQRTLDAAGVPSSLVFWI